MLNVNIYILMSCLIFFNTTHFLVILTVHKQIQFLHFLGRLKVSQHCFEEIYFSYKGLVKSKPCVALKEFSFKGI